jgi:hypothetical protein
MSEESTSKVAELWKALGDSLQSLQKDLAKNTVKRNVSAGVRLRKGLRDVRRQVSEIIKETLQADKSVTESRAAKRESAKPEGDTASG